MRRWFLVGTALALRIRYPGAETIAIEEDGRSLLVRTGHLQLRERGLRCFQEAKDGQRAVPFAYTMAGSDLAFAVGPYDRRAGLAGPRPS